VLLIHSGVFLAIRPCLVWGKRCRNEKVASLETEIVCAWHRTCRWASSTQPRTSTREQCLKKVFTRLCCRLPSPNPSRMRARRSCQVLHTCKKHAEVEHGVCSHACTVAHKQHGVRKLKVGSTRWYPRLVVGARVHATLGSTCIKRCEGMLQRRRCQALCAHSTPGQRLVIIV
jgi:hypothetical protein